MRALSIVAGNVAAIARIVVIGVVVWLATVAGVAAADPDAVTLAAQKAQLFQQMMRDPSNLDVTFAYADVSARLGDNEAAIAALERMLLFNPNLPRVDLELGVLYYRLGSFEAAQTYFEKAKSFNPPPEVVARVDEYLGKIAAAQGPSQFSGYIFVGAQYQTDANVAPGSPLVISPIGAVLLSNQFVKHDDGNIFGTGTFLYSYDLGTQNRDTVEVTGTGFLNHYFQFNRLDLDLGELTAGPRLRFPHLVDMGPILSATLKPYAIVNEVGLGEKQYFYTYGAGIEGTALLFDDLSAKLAYEIRRKTFTNAVERPLSSGLTGTDNLVSLAFNKPLTANSWLTSEFDFLDQSTKFNFFTNKTYAISAGYRTRYDDPTGLLNLPWETVVFGSRSWSIYAAPDPCCVTGGSLFAPSFSSRDDRHWRFGVTQTFQVSANMAVVLQVQRDIVSSNLSIYGYTSNSVLVGPQIRF
jgi:hypothetical protein